ncbi:hypothetical protein Tco_0681546 [Tanacetum coccineum]|uniref:Reverse transcriptase domain-containing protein n=1 Tax=Tanacetum coccineum TaxID=301880 RepID=A0ABQ4XPJ4_9ASTR
MLACNLQMQATNAYLHAANARRKVISTDKSKITRKQSKSSKHGHENLKSTKRSLRIKANARKVKPQSNPVNHVSTDAPLSNSSPSNNSFDMQQIAASLEDKMTIKMNKMLNEMKALVVTPAPVKAVEENQMANVTSLLTSLCDNFKNSASTSNSGTLPSQTVTNPRQQINAITTRSGKALEEPSIPLVPSPDVSKPQKEPEQNPLDPRQTEKVRKSKIGKYPHHVHLRKKIPFSLKSQNQKQRNQIGLKDALVEMPKFNKWLSSLLRNKEKLEEIAITTVNAECSAIIMNKVPEKLEDPGKFLSHKLGLEALTPTRMTLEAAKPFHSHPIGKIRFSGSTTNSLHPSSSPVKTSDNIEKFTDELAPLDSLPSGNDDSTLKKEFHEVNFQVYSNPLFEFDESFKSSNVNPLFEENNKDVEIKSSSSSTLTSPEASELEDYLEKDSIPPGIDLTLPTTLEVLSSNPTFPTLTKEKVCAWETPMFFSLVRFVWKMMTRIAIRKKIICILATYLHKKPKILSRPQEVEEIKEKEDEIFT